MTEVPTFLAGLTAGLLLISGLYALAKATGWRPPPSPNADYAVETLILFAWGTAFLWFLLR